MSDEDYAALGSPHTMSKSTTCHPITALADTGCQSCLSGTNLLHTFGYTTSDLIPVTTKMSSASGENIKIIGAVPLRLSGSDAHGRTYTTRQMVYITDRPGPFFLSRGACTDLGVISDRFPTIGEASKPPENASVTNLSYTLLEPNHQH